MSETQANLKLTATDKTGPAFNSVVRNITNLGAKTESLTGIMGHIQDSAVSFGAGIGRSMLAAFSIDKIARFAEEGYKGAAKTERAMTRLAIAAGDTRAEMQEYKEELIR